MARNTYQGDPKLYLRAEGSYLKFVDGQPRMDGGMENRVIIPLFTRRRSKFNRKPWVGNLVFDNQAHHLGTDFEEGFEDPITIGLIEAQEKQGKKALQSLIDTNLASDITIDIVNPSSYRLDMTVLVESPKIPEFKLLAIRNSVNWIIQGDDPADPDPPTPDPVPYGFGNYEFGNGAFGTGD